MLKTNAILLGQGLKLYKQSSGLYLMKKINTSNVEETLITMNDSGIILLNPQSVENPAENDDSKNFATTQWSNAKMAALNQLMSDSLAALNLTLNDALNNLIPKGTVVYYLNTTVPNGFIKANGAAISRTTYSALFNSIGTTFGTGNGSTTFNVPDLRGLFLRVWDDGRTLDNGRGFGTYQEQDIQPHTHLVVSPATATGSGAYNPGGVLKGSSGDFANYGAVSITSQANAGSETRPKNIALQALIKF